MRDVDFRDLCARCALANDTAMSRAMLRALGIPIPHRPAPGTIVRVDRYADAGRLMAQRYGVRM